jgi:hypothetical protein
MFGLSASQKTKLPNEITQRPATQSSTRLGINHYRFLLMIVAKVLQRSMDDVMEEDVIMSRPKSRSASRPSIKESLENLVTERFYDLNHFIGWHYSSRMFILFRVDNEQ